MYIFIAIYIHIYIYTCIYIYFCLYAFDNICIYIYIYCFKYCLTHDISMKYMCTATVLPVVVPIDWMIQSETPGRCQCQELDCIPILFRFSVWDGWPKAVYHSVGYIHRNYDLYTYACIFIYLYLHIYIVHIYIYRYRYIYI